MIRYFRYWTGVFRCVVVGNRAYYQWMGFLLVLIAMGGLSWSEHLKEGLVVTNMTDQVSWGIGIANFVYFVGVAAAAAVLVVPAYAYGVHEVKDVVLLGELLAVVAVTMCLLFITSDVGKPFHLWHLAPMVGVLNLPSSMLAWDVLVFAGYLVLNLVIPGYLLYKKYANEPPKGAYYLPLVFLSMLWAVSIHTVTAFLLAGLGSRHFWNSALLAPRFLISAGASGPALLIVIFALAQRYAGLEIKPKVFDYLKHVLRITMPINLFLLGCEAFGEFYTGIGHAAAARYLYFGWRGHVVLPGFIWTAFTFNVVATTIWLVPRFRNHRVGLFLACGLTIVGIWIEKGMGLIFPGFTPSPLGEVIEYAPNLGELLVCFGILALGAFMFTAMAKVAIAIQTGRLRTAAVRPESGPAAGLRAAAAGSQSGSAA